MLRTVLVGAALTVALAGSALAQSSAAVQAAQKACRPDAMSLCAGVPRGEKMMQCLQANQAQLSTACQQALAALTASQQQ